MCTILMRAAVLLLAAACGAHLVGADASADAACAAEAAAEFEAIVTRRGESNVTAVIEAGCRGEASTEVCDVRGSSGPCSANPACPADQITSFGCTTANEASGCCLVDFRKPCDGCEPIVTGCLNLCDGPPPPAQDRFEIAIRDAESTCVDRAAFRLSQVADSTPDRFTVSGCDSADPGVVCDTVGAFSRCEDLPICAGANIGNQNCTARTVNQSCCTALIGPPCENCAPETLACLQECLDSPPFDTGPPAAAGAPPVEFGPALVCANRAVLDLQDLAATNPDSFADGCDDADELVVCDIQSSVGSCEDNPICPSDQIERGRCTAENGPPECCDVAFSRPCDGCDPILLQCTNVCASNVPPEVSAAEELNRFCVDEADVATAVRQTDGRFPPSCADAQFSEICEVEGTGGACSAGTACSGVEVQLADTCSVAEAAAEEGCCFVRLAPPCPGCDPEPFDCIQTCN